jgi:hypothetical protein
LILICQIIWKEIWNLTVISMYLNKESNNMSTTMDILQQYGLFYGQWFTSKIQSGLDEPVW